MRQVDGSIVRAIRGPVTLITVGVLFALNNFTPYGFDKTWPILLIVFGLLSLLRRGMEPVPPPVPPQPFPPYGYPAQAPAPAAPGGYAQSSYAAPPQQPPSPAKGGFGSSAPPRAGDAGQGGAGQGGGNAPPSGDNL
jgi:Domain of unknown function (DUF5668)